MVYLRNRVNTQTFIGGPNDHPDEFSRAAELTDRRNLKIGVVANLRRNLLFPLNGWDNLPISSLSSIHEIPHLGVIVTVNSTFKVYYRAILNKNNAIPTYILHESSKRFQNFNYFQVPCNYTFKTVVFILCKNSGRLHNFSCINCTAAIE